MSNLIYRELQTQEVDSATVTLWELQIGDTTYAYFHSGLDDSLSDVQFRDRETPTTINTYAALPMQGEGFALKSDGALVRPTLTVANILTTFSGALGGLTNKELLGKKLYRRRTLFKYCFGQPGDSNPPVEYPIQMYYIDRIASETRTSITFELAAAYDITGIKLPRRVIIGNTCSWKYQGAAPETAVGSRIGGCPWSKFSLLDIEGTEYTVWYNKKSEQVVPSGAVDTVTNPTSGVTANYIYRTTADTSNLFRITSDGDLVSPGTVYDYWQALVTNSAPGTPSDNNAMFRRVRIYTTYATGDSYSAYTNPEYNSYTSYTLGGESDPRLWQVKNISQDSGAHDSTPQQNGYWKLGDECAKTLDACARRFNHKPVTVTGSNSVGAATKNSSKALPFGGFPGTRIFS